MIDINIIARCATCHRNKRSQFHNLFSTEHNISSIIDAKNSDDKFIFLSAAFWLQIIRFIKSALFTRGSRRVIYCSGLFTNTTGGGHGTWGGERVLVTKIMRWIPPLLSTPQLRRVDAPSPPTHPPVTPLINFNKPTTVSRLISVSREEGRENARSVLLPKFRVRSEAEIRWRPTASNSRMWKDVLP